MLASETENYSDGDVVDGNVLNEETFEHEQPHEREIEDFKAQLEAELAKAKEEDELNPVAIEGDEATTSTTTTGLEWTVFLSRYSR